MSNPFLRSPWLSAPRDAAMGLCTASVEVWPDIDGCEVVRIGHTLHVATPEGRLLTRHGISDGQNVAAIVADMRADAARVQGELFGGGR